MRAVLRGLGSGRPNRAGWGLKFPDCRVTPADAPSGSGAISQVERLEGAGQLHVVAAGLVKPGLRMITTRASRKSISPAAMPAIFSKLRGAASIPSVTGVVAQIQRDLSRESSVLAGQHEQTSEDGLQDHQLAKLESGAEEGRITDRLVRSLDALGSHSVGASRPSTGL